MFAEYRFTQKTRESEKTAQVVPLAGAAEPGSGLRAALQPCMRKFAKGDSLLFEGDEGRSVYLVLDGWLALSKSLEDGNNQIIDFLLTGDIADPVGADGVTASVTVEALTDGSLAAVPHGTWERLIIDWPELNHAAHLVEAANQARHAERILRLGKGSAEMRVAYALAEFCIRIDAASDETVPEIHVPLTQQQLGDYLGLSSVHVCRTMRRMARKGIVEMHDHMDIRVLDKDALAKMAGVDCEALKREILPAAIQGPY